MRPSRPRVLTFLAVYLPGFRDGGPLRTIANMVDRLSDDFEFHIVAADRDVGDRQPYPNVAINRWNDLAGAKVFYRTPGAPGWRAFLESQESAGYELIYLNSLFCTEASLRPLVYRCQGRLADRPVLLAPRGELDDGALSLKPLKKSAFLAAARTLGVYGGINWHASSIGEKAAIIQHTGALSNNVFVATNLSGKSDGNPISVRPRNLGDPLRLVFFSRISPKKNLQFALDVLSRISFPVTLDIYGVMEDANYWRMCERRISALPANVTAQFRGEINPVDVERTLSSYDLFFFPTLGENYGHVIREALSAGVPALISDTTPWRGLAQRGAGADFSLNEPGSFVDWLENFNKMDTGLRLRMCHAAREMGDDTEGAARNLEANRAMFNAVLSRGRGVD